MGMVQRDRSRAPEVNLALWLACDDVRGSASLALCPIRFFEGHNQLNPVAVASWDELEDRVPLGALVSGVDLVIVRTGNDHRVLYGRCLHRGALMADGIVRGDDLVCGLHGWDYRIDSGISSYNSAERLHRFDSYSQRVTASRHRRSNLAACWRRQNRFAGS